MVSFESFFETTAPYFYYDRLNPYLLFLRPENLNNFAAHFQHVFVCMSLIYIVFAQILQCYLSYMSTGNVVVVTESLAWVVIGIICIDVCWTIHSRMHRMYNIIVKLKEIYPKDPTLLLTIGADRVLNPLFKALKVFQTAYVGTLLYKIFLPLVEGLRAYVQSGDSEFRLSLHVWYPFDPYNPLPRLVLVFLFEALGAFLSTCPMLTITAIVGGITSSLCVQFKLLGHEFRRLGEQKGSSGGQSKYNHEIRCQLIHLLYRHQFLLEIGEEVKSIFSSFLLGNYVFCSIGMSLFMFVSAISDKQDVVIEYVGNVICFIFYITTLSVFGHRYREESMGVSTAIYEGHWLEMEPRVRVYLRMIMMRTSKPLFLTGRGFFHVSLESCTKMLTTAYSYFALMRTAFHART